MFLKESLTQQWNVMMDYFTQILQRMLAASKGSSSRSSDFGEATLFKIYFNLDFHVYEGQIDSDDLDKWLSSL